MRTRFQASIRGARSQDSYECSLRRDAEGIATNPGCKPPMLPGDVHTWPGFCFVLNPDGETVAESDRRSHQQSILYCDLEGSAVDYFRDFEGAGNMMEHRRPETYGRLQEPVSHRPRFCGFVAEPCPEQLSRALFCVQARL